MVLSGEVRYRVRVLKKLHEVSGGVPRNVYILWVFGKLSRQLGRGKDSGLTYTIFDWQPLRIRKPLHCTPTYDTNNNSRTK